MGNGRDSFGSMKDEDLAEFRSIPLYVRYRYTKGFVRVINELADAQSSFTWYTESDDLHDPDDTLPENLVVRGIFTTVHTYAYAGFFKPTHDEVLNSILRAQSGRDKLSWAIKSGGVLLWLTQLEDLMAYGLDGCHLGVVALLGPSTPETDGDSADPSRRLTLEILLEARPSL